LNQAFGGESRERLTDSSLTGIELLAQLADAQRRTRFESAIEQRIAQLIVSALGQAGFGAGAAVLRSGAQGVGSVGHVDPKVYIETKSIPEYFGDVD
jgi:hypothetical protein